MDLQLMSSKFVLGLACGIVIGAVGYKLVHEQKLNPQELTSTIREIAGKFKQVTGEQGASKGRGKGRAASKAKGGHGGRAKA